MTKMQRMEVTNNEKITTNDMSPITAISQGRPSTSSFVQIKQITKNLFKELFLKS